MRLYFVYGSNLCLKRFKDPSRVPSASFKCVATLEGYRVFFWKRSVDGSGKATIVRDPDSNVVVALFSYEDKDHEKLKKAEAGYAECIVAIKSSAGKKEVLTFICDSQKVDRTLQPYDWYLDLIRYGGRELGLPAEYLSRFDSVVAKVDPNAARAARERTFLK